MRRIHKITTLVLIGTMVIAGKTAIVKAAEDPIAGITVALDEYYQTAENTQEATVQNLLEEISANNSLAFAQVNNYVNIRNKASEEGEILGKLYDSSAATIISKDNGWYKIKSGSVTGYVKADYLVTGDAAVSLAKKLGSRIATVNTTTLKVRKSASTDADVITLVAQDDDFKVAAEQDGWVKIRLDENSYGYVSSDYVTVQTVYEEAVSIEEEQQRLQEEETANSNDNNSSSSGDSSSVSTGSSSGSSASSLGSKIADYAVQFRGNPYVWGGTSLTNGADCSGFTQSVFAHFGIYIPRTSRTQATGGRRVSFSDLRPGDLIFYARNGYINHVAIYIGGGRVISASSPSTGIRITSYNYRTPYKAVRYL